MKKYTASNDRIYRDRSFVEIYSVAEILNEHDRIASEASEKRASMYREMEKMRKDAEKYELLAQKASIEKDRYKSMLKFIVDKL